MEQFLMVAVAHFLALLSPGPDFFLIARTSAVQGWRLAAGVCAGVAVANAVFIVLAFSGVSVFRPGSLLFEVVQWAGCLYLLYLGGLFLRHAGRTPLMLPDTVAQVSRDRQSTARGLPGQVGWWRNFMMGFMSGGLNPKNALFYVSLAAMLGQQPDLLLAGYGLWMFGVVLGWDVLVALAIGNRAILSRFARILPAVERITGVCLIGLAVAVLASRG
ncbi:LysE family translocator [Corticimicrobacter populi]|uniref:Lysine transporter LysE n=1 Tax=Corticimicrobacter populi TaxID=2175229 RepID=A0A2V1JYL6_9BURK|nr:LysE family translocator [Corticimicrobacter populi]PWF22574.1 lysine transporter LysE [Corticimicrobacter populi]